MNTIIAELKTVLEHLVHNECCDTIVDELQKIIANEEQYFGVSKWTRENVRELRPSWSNAVVDEFIRQYDDIMTSAQQEFGWDDLELFVNDFELETGMVEK